MDWQTTLIAEVVAGFGLYIAIACAIGLVLRRFDREGRQ